MFKIGGFFLSFERVVVRLMGDHLRDAETISRISNTEESRWNAIFQIDRESLSTQKQQQQRNRLKHPATDPPIKLRLGTRETQSNSTD